VRGPDAWAVMQGDGVENDGGGLLGQTHLFGHLVSHSGALQREVGIPRGRQKARVVKHGCGVEELLVDFGAGDDAQRQPEAERPPAVVEEHGRQPPGRGFLGASSEHGARRLQALRGNVGVAARVQVQRQSSSADDVSHVSCRQGAQQRASFGGAEPSAGVLHPGDGADLASARARAWLGAVVTVVRLAGDRGLLLKRDMTAPS
jgi:hypothetical protein